jgi:hypothetical protein
LLLQVGAQTPALQQLSLLELLQGCALLHAVEHVPVTVLHASPFGQSAGPAQPQVCEGRQAKPLLLVLQSVGTLQPQLAPPMHTVPDAAFVQSTQLVPLPHATFAVPPTQLPLASQQPLAHGVEALHVAKHAPALSASPVVHAPALQQPLAQSAVALQGMMQAPAAQVSPLGQSFAVWQPHCPPLKQARPAAPAASQLVHTPVVPQVVGSLPVAHKPLSTSQQPPLHRDSCVQ